MHAVPKSWTMDVVDYYRGCYSNLRRHVLPGWKSKYDGRGRRESPRIFSRTGQKTNTAAFHAGEDPHESSAARQYLLPVQGGLALHINAHRRLAANDVAA